MRMMNICSTFHGDVIVENIYFTSMQKWCYKWKVKGSSKSVSFIHFSLFQCCETSPALYLIKPLKSADHVYQMSSGLYDFLSKQEHKLHSQKVKSQRKPTFAAVLYPTNTFLLWGWPPLHVCQEPDISKSATAGKEIWKMKNWRAGGQSFLDVQKASAAPPRSCWSSD